MEFGTSSRLPSGQNVVGVSWTSSGASAADAYLITTTEARIQIHAADDQRVISSWLTRPGSYNHFSVAAVQHRVWRQMFVVQNGTRLFSWADSQTSLESAKKVTLRGEAFSLRTSKHIPALLCVYRDGGVSVFDDKLQELFWAAGTSASATTAAGSANSATSTSATTRSSARISSSSSATSSSSSSQVVEPVAPNHVATWARLTSIPGQPGRCILMILTQQTASESTLTSSQPPYSPPVLRIFTISTTTTTPPLAAGGGGNNNSSTTATSPPVVLRYASTHILNPPSSTITTTSSSSTMNTVSISAITLHKHLHQLGVIWSNGHFQMLKFGRGVTTSGGTGTAAAATTPAPWFASTTPLTEVFTRDLARLLPDSSSSTKDGTKTTTTTTTTTKSSSGKSTSSSSQVSSFHCAAFALEPSCVVLAGTDRGNSSNNAVVGMSVWDVRYGIMLGVKAIGNDELGNSSGEILDEEDDQEEEEEEENREEDDTEGKTGAPITNSKSKGGKSKSSNKDAKQTSQQQQQQQQQGKNGANQKGGRTRSDSVGSAGSVGSLLSSAQAVSGTGVLTPDSIFQVTVSEDGAFVAVASRRRVVLTPVAVQGASLASSVGRLPLTQPLLLSSSSSANSIVTSSNNNSSIMTSLMLGTNSVQVRAAPSLDLSACLNAAALSSKSSSSSSHSGTSSDSSATSSSSSLLQNWSRIVTSSQSRVALDCKKLLQASDTPTADAMQAILTEYTSLSTAGSSMPSSSSSSSSSTASTKPPTNKRIRGAKPDATMAEEVQPLPFLPASFRSFPLPIPQPIVLACLQRCIAEFTETGVSGNQQPQPKKDGEELVNASFASILSSLLRAGVVSISLVPTLLPTILKCCCSSSIVGGGAAATASSSSVASKPAVVSKKAATITASSSSATTTTAVRKERSNVTALRLLRDILLFSTDIPESSLVQIFVYAVRKVSAASLGAFWQSIIDECPSLSFYSMSATTTTTAAGAGDSSSTTTSSSATATSNLSKTKQKAKAKRDPAVLGLLYIAGLIVRAPRNDVFMESALQGLDGDDVSALLACLSRLLALHMNTFVGLPVNIPVTPKAALAVALPESLSTTRASSRAAKIGAGATAGAGSGGSSSSLTEGTTTNDEMQLPAENNDNEGDIIGEALEIAPKAWWGKFSNNNNNSAKRARAEDSGAVSSSSSSSSSASAMSAASSTAAAASTTIKSQPISALFPLPTYGQVLDWIRMVMDAHFTRIVLLARADDAAALADSNSNSNNHKHKGKKSLASVSYNTSLGIQRILADISAKVATATSLCDSAADLRGHLSHVLQRQPLPQPPEPEYSVDILRV